jgi:tryptophan synthase beta chain
MTDIETMQMPVKNGYFGEYGGQILPPHLIDIINKINDSYNKLR